MPKNCSPIKADLVKEYGGNLVLRLNNIYLILIVILLRNPEWIQ